MFSRLQSLSRFSTFLSVSLGFLLAAQVVWFVLTMATWLDEGNYLYKSTALVGHGIDLYSLELPCWYTPLYLVGLGVWQELMGLGLISGRLFSITCFVLLILVLSRIGKELFPGKSQLPWVLGLIVLTPSVTLFHSSVTQFAFVNLQLAALLWVLFVLPGDRFRWVLAGLLIGGIAMTRPNLILVVPLFALLYFWLRGWQGWKPWIQLGVAWLVTDFVIIGIFGPGAFWNMIRTFPGAELVARLPFLARDPGIGTLQGTDLGLQVSLWWKVRPEHTTGSHVYFWKGFLWPYLLIVLINLAGVIRWRSVRFRPSLAAGFALIFFWSALLHFAAVQSFCKNCAYAYMNYSMVPGILGAIGNLPVVLGWIGRGASNRRWLPAAVGGLAAVWVILAWLPGGPYRKFHAPKTVASIGSLAEKLEEILPGDAHLLALGFDVRMVEAIHLSGRTVDPVTINYFFSRREPIDPREKIDDERREKVRRRGLWTDQTLAHSLVHYHNYVLFRDGMVPHRQILEEQFTVQELFPEEGDGGFLSSIRLAVRRPTQPETLSLTDNQ